MPKRLRELEVAEVSLVDKAANGRKFLLLKRDDEEDESVDEEVTLRIEDRGMLEVLKYVAGNGKAGTRVEEALVKEGLSDKAKVAVHVALRALEMVKDELPEDILSMLAELGGYPRPEAEPAKDEIAKEGNTSAKVKMLKEDGTPDMASIPEELRPVVETLWKQSKANAERAAETERLLKAEQEKLAKEREERAVRDAVARVKEELAYLPSAAEKLGPILLKAARALGEEEYKELDRVLHAASEAFRQGLLQERGSGEQDAALGNSAYARLAGKAREIQKSEGGTFEQAFSKAVDRFPELAREERAERDRAVRSGGGAH